VPLQAPEAVQVVALAEDQVNVALDPLPIVLALDFKLTVGTAGFAAVDAATVTVTECESDPPDPVQVRSYVDVALSAPVDTLPLVAFVPLQDPEA
jgi:hypothetical protein